MKSCVTALGALTDRPAAILLLNERDGIEDSQIDCACGMHGERNKYRIFVGKPEARRPLERPKIRWKFKCKKGNLFPVHAMKTREVR